MYSSRRTTLMIVMLMWSSILATQASDPLATQLKMARQSRQQQQLLEEKKQTEWKYPPLPSPSLTPLLHQMFHEERKQMQEKLFSPSLNYPNLKTVINGDHHVHNLPAQLSSSTKAQTGRERESP